jgi:hypothetical protein
VSVANDDAEVCVTRKKEKKYVLGGMLLSLLEGGGRRRGGLCVWRTTTREVCV